MRRSGFTRCERPAEARLAQFWQAGPPPEGRVRRPAGAVPADSGPGTAICLPSVVSGGRNLLPAPLAAAFTE